MSVEVLLLALLCGITLLAYMVAINAHGPTRLSLSYLIATVMLAGTVYAIVQHVNSGLDTMKMEELRKLEMEKKAVEEKAHSQEIALQENQYRMGFAGKMNTILTSGAGYASTMINVDLQDKNADLETLIARAASSKKRCDSLKEEFNKLGAVDPIFNECISNAKEGINYLCEAANFYKLYYYAEDTEQEEMRQRVLRQRAKSSYEKFRLASTKLAEIGAK